jgi:hypothetical protein
MLDQPRRLGAVASGEDFVRIGAVFEINAELVAYTLP